MKNNNFYIFENNIQKTYMKIKTSSKMLFFMLLLNLFFWYKEKQPSKNCAYFYTI